jgi:hypothetical protein
MADVAQPWTNENDEEQTYELKLRYRLYSEVIIENCELALEEMEQRKLNLMELKYKKSKQVIILIKVFERLH